MPEHYTVVDERGGAVYIGASRAAVHWHMEHGAHHVESGPDNFFNPNIFTRFIRFITGLFLRLLSLLGRA